MICCILGHSSPNVDENTMTEIECRNMMLRMDEIYRYSIRGIIDSIVMHNCVGVTSYIYILSYKTLNHHLNEDKLFRHLHTNSLKRALTCPEYL